MNFCSVYVFVLSEGLSVEYDNISLQSLFMTEAEFMTVRFFFEVSGFLGIILIVLRLDG